MANFKQPMHRDRKYLDWLREQPCMITGVSSHEYETVDPAHTGTGGKGFKSHDKHALPLMHHLHLESHNNGSTSFWCRVLGENPAILNELLTCYAENVYYKRYMEK